MDDGEHALWLPFVVAGAAPRADALVLVPTFSWQAYSSNRQPFTWTEDGAIDLSLGTYDLHADGSPVYYTSARRPHRAGAPDRGFRAYGAHNLTANLYLIDWLDELAIPYDVASDHHLHRDGPELLSPYRCVVLGSHPEYWSAAMLQALVSYQEAGGRVMYLGGNGLYWVTSVDPERPWLIEVRKRGEGDFAGRIPVRDGESIHSTTLESGGTWASRGLPPRAVVGVEFAANAHPHTTPHAIAFERTDAARDPRYRFVFDGLTPDEPIGGFGAGVGGAGYEMDAVFPEPLPGRRVVGAARARLPPDLLRPAPRSRDAGSRSRAARDLRGRRRVRGGIRHVDGAALARGATGTASAASPRTCSGASSRRRSASQCSISRRRATSPRAARPAPRCG